jgi:hypothetical protein
MPDVQRAAGAGVMHGSAAKRRKPGGEHHGAINRILVGHDAFAESGHAHIEHRQYETLGELFRRFFGAAVLDRLTVFPLV